MPPSATPLSVAGNWQGSFTLPTGVIGDTTVWGSVLPDGGLFFYTNSSLDHNALYGRLIRYENNVTNNRFVTANDGVFFNRLLGNTGTYNEAVLIDGTLQSSNGSGNASLFSGSFSYPTQPGGFPTRFSVTPDPLYALPAGKVATTAMIVGTFKMAGTGFGGDTTTLKVFAAPVSLPRMMMPGERLVFTDAFRPGWIPSGKPFMTAEVTFDEVDGKTLYTARAMHWNQEDRQAHEAMGFHDGWGQSLDRLVTLVTTDMPD